MTLSKYSRSKDLSCKQIWYWKYRNTTIACRPKKQQKDTKILYLIKVSRASNEKKKSHPKLLNTIIKPLRDLTSHSIIYDMPTPIQFCAKTTKQQRVKLQELSLESIPKPNL